MASRTEANGESVLVHYLDLKEYGLEDVPREFIEDVKQEVADYLQDEILRKVSDGVSPVSGEGRFRRLKEEYAIREKGGRRLSDLENEGDLKDSLIVEPEGDSFIVIGHRGEQVPKADGHNQLSSKASSWASQNGFPRRRYIPDSSQRFDSDITAGIKDIVQTFRRRAPARQESLGEEVDQIRPSSTQRSSLLDSFFSDNVIEALLKEAQARRR